MTFETLMMFIRKDNVGDAKKEVAGGSRDPESSGFPVAQPQQSAGAGREVLWNPVQAKFEILELSHRKDRLKERFHAVNRRSSLSLSLSLSLSFLSWSLAMAGDRQN
jgi:hypothetical protein